jgi:DNA repair exonuclease SbcCD nuclease subunit
MFAFMGDSRGHTGVLKKIIREAIQARCPFAIYGGDLVDECNERELGAFCDAVRHASQGRLPVYIVIGNHDVGPQGSTAEFQAFFGPTDYVLWYGPDVFVIFDDAEGFTAEKAASLDRTLSSVRPKARNVFLVAHIPPVDPDPAKEHCLGPTGAARLKALAKKHGVTAMFFSHIHAYVQTSAEGIPVIISGGAGARLEKGGRYHWVKIQVDGTNVAAEEMRLDAGD